MSNKTPKILYICSQGASSNFVHQALHANFELVGILIDEPISRQSFLKNRIRKQGLFNVLSQILFVGFAVPLLHRFSRKRRAEITFKSGLIEKPLESGVVINRGNVNGVSVRRALQELNYDAIVVNGTRILSSSTIAAAKTPIINTHAGITPDYRGAHGGYWALYNGEPDKCGVTVHVIDEGIDTGNVIAQALISPTGDDNFTTYPLLQIAAGIPLLIDAVAMAAKGNLQTLKNTNSGGIWYHPGIFQYLLAVVRGIK